MSLSNTSLNRLYIGLPQERQGSAVGITVPAPTGGLNTRDNEANMAITDAIEMTNWVPEVGKCVSLRGYSEFATGLSGNVETILEYYSGTTRRMIACSDGNVYNASAGGDVSSSTLGTGFGSARWQGTNFRGTLCMVNGTDAPQGYDGSTLSALTISGSGLTVATLKGVVSHKNRLWWWDGSSQEVWYSAIDTIGGSLTKFPLDRVGQFGGFLLAAATWSIDGGDGIDDYLVFFMSGGQVLVYSGTDPASDFALVGTYTIPPPVSQRSVIELAGDIIFSNAIDFTFFSKVFREQQVITNLSKLTGAITKAYDSYKDNYGWQTIYYPKRGWIIINIPESTNNTYVQYAINTLTQAAFKIENWNAICFGIYNQDLYFGSNTIIYKADNTLKNDDDFIKTKVNQAYSNLNIPSPKSINHFSPSLKADGNVNLSLEVIFDFNDANLEQAVSVESVGTPWDTSAWDTSDWSPEARVQDTKYLTSGQGTYLSLAIESNLKAQQVEWYNTNYSIDVNNL